MIVLRFSEHMQYESNPSNCLQSTYWDGLMLLHEITGSVASCAVQLHKLGISSFQKNSRIIPHYIISNTFHWTRAVGYIRAYLPPRCSLYPIHLGLYIAKTISVAAKRDSVSRLKLKAHRDNISYKTIHQNEN